MIDGFSFFFGAVLVVVAFLAGCWIIGLDKIEYGRQRFREGRASGIAAERHEQWLREQNRGAQP